MKRLILLAILPCLALAAEEGHRVHALRIQLLSTMLADSGIGEWGFSAIVDVDGHRILFDTGARPDTVLINSNVLKVDLSNVDQVILTHNHDDHTGGLITLRKAYSAKNPNALSTAHVGKGIFDSRKAGSRPGEGNPMIATKTAYEASGGRFIVHDAPVELLPGVWLTGPVPRKYPEKNWSPGVLLNTSSGTIEDYLPEDQSLVFD